MQTKVVSAVIMPKHRMCLIQNVYDKTNGFYKYMTAVKYGKVFC